MDHGINAAFPKYLEIVESLNNTRRLIWRESWTLTQFWKHLSGLISVVVVVFQIIFRTEIYQNDIFLFFKKLFLRSACQNDPKHTKKFNFLKKRN